MKNKLKIRTAICAVLTAAICLGGCAADLSSSKEERETVMRVGDYDVPYEVLRYYVMNFRADGVDDPDGRAKEAIKSLYAMMSLAADYDIDANGEYISSLANDTVNEAIADCGGEKEYKKAIAENNMNDSVFRLLSKNSILREEIYVKMLSAGDIDTDENHMREIIGSDEFICVKQILIMGENSQNTQDGTVVTPAKTHTDEEAAALAETARERAESGEDFDSLVAEYGESLYMFSNTDGYYLCRGMWDIENENAAFALEIGEVSSVIKSRAGYSVFKRCEKSSEYIEKNLNKISNDYYGALLALAVEDRAKDMSIEMLIDIPDTFSEIK